MDKDQKGSLFPSEFAGFSEQVLRCRRNILSLSTVILMVIVCGAEISHLPFGLTFKANAILPQLFIFLIQAYFLIAFVTSAILECKTQAATSSKANETQTCTASLNDTIAYIGNQIASLTTKQPNIDFTKLSEQLTEYKKYQFSITATMNIKFCYEFWLPVLYGACATTIFLLELITMD
ncbi:hypothetical protein [Halodesulfovibrio sp.]|uniref:hypothetical protein n=1 Tax=Halodesulfovibrio sp. TaxID=1912772 RepID=UPI0025C6CE89|nr:hypothetical protein [Halodesulfovibrio sp.]